MFRVLLLCTVLLLLAGCAASSLPRPPIPEEGLLSGSALLGSPAQLPISADDVFAIDEQMRTFVHEQVDGVRSPEMKLKRLLLGMEKHGLFSIDYSLNTTRTVRETFHERHGNCLSFTMLFVTLAREAGLRADYQMVDIPPTWSADSDLVLLTSHINVLVRTDAQPDYVVDFNYEDYKGNYPRRKVSDRYALALFYSNRGVEALIAQDYETSFTYFKSAIDAYPDIPGPWVNLGLLYSRQGLYEHAEAAYLQALEADRRNRSALTNLTVLYSTTGKPELAEEYQKRIRSYQQRNPYYHYSLARAAFDERRFADTLSKVERAIRLKREEHQFHFLQGLAYLELGQKRSAQHSFVRAKEYAEYSDIKAQYEARIAALALN